MTGVQRSRNRGEVQKPIVVDRYNQSMNGVDRADQNCVYYSERAESGGGSYFFWLVEVAVRIPRRKENQTHLTEYVHVTLHYIASYIAM